MDDDLTFGASVWATSDFTDTPPARSGPATTTSATILPPPLDDEPVDDFDDFGPATAAPDDDFKDDDDFGDFGDFDESQPVTTTPFEDEPGLGFRAIDDLPIAGPSTHWRALALDPFPSRQNLQSEIDETLGPLWGYEDIDAVTSDEGIREAEGLAQILVAQSSRDMYRSLLQAPPPTRPPNWTRSRIRRQHLISLGIPVNLDEVLPRAGGKPMPTLEIHTRPMSAPPGPRNAAVANGSATAHNSRPGTPQPGQRGKAGQLGQKPELDMNKVNKLLALSPESLTMQPLPNLERHLSDIRQQIANTSDLLTYLLRTRDVLQQDSETYNGLIAEMVGEAQKMKSGKPTRTASYSRRGATLS